MSIFSKIGGAMRGAGGHATGPMMIPGVGGIGGQLSQPGPMMPPPPVMIERPQIPGSPPPPTGVLAEPQDSPSVPGGLMGVLQAGAMGRTPTGLPNGMPMQGAAPGGIAAMLRAAMQRRAQAPDPSSMLRSQYPGMGTSNAAGNGSE